MANQHRRILTSVRSVVSILIKLVVAIHLVPALHLLELRVSVIFPEFLLFINRHVIFQLRHRRPV